MRRRAREARRVQPPLFLHRRRRERARTRESESARDIFAVAVAAVRVAAIGSYLMMRTRPRSGCRKLLPPLSPPADSLVYLI